MAAAVAAGISAGMLAALLAAPVAATPAGATFVARLFPNELHGLSGSDWSVVEQLCSSRVAAPTALTRVEHSFVWNGCEGPTRQLAPKVIIVQL